MSQTPVSSSLPLLVSTFGASLDPQSRKEIESIIVKAGHLTRQIHQAISPGGGHQEAFDPPLEVSFDAKIVVSVHYRKTFRSVVTISLDPQEVLDRTKEEDGKHLYRKTERKVEVVIGIQSLPSTVGEVLASCSRFRVLIIGETGSGKSALIHKVFGVTGLDSSDTTRGEARIDQGYIASNHDHFIVHDSCGFEAADQENLTAVRNFISDRRRRRDLKDQLHAVWLCLEIPFAGSRLLESGAEDFLQNKHDVLGNIPLIVVFTKLDLLVNVLEADALEKGRLLHDAALKKCTLALLDKLCLTPVQRAAENNSASVAHVAVSTMEGYEESLGELVDVTTSHVQTYVKEKAAQYIAALAQRVDKPHPSKLH